MITKRQIGVGLAVVVLTVAAIFVIVFALTSSAAGASEDPCRVAYVHADKSSETRACEVAASAGDADEQLGFGLILWSGDQATHDRRAALEWFRKSARQGNHIAQIFLADTLKRQDIDANLRNPVEAYAWMVTLGDQGSANALRASLSEADAARADAMAADYRSKYSWSEASSTGKWFRASNSLFMVWPGLVILGFFLARRRRLARKLPFILAGLVVAFASPYLALWALVAVANALMMRLAGAALDLAVWTFGLAFVLGLLAPLLGVWTVYRFWVYRGWIRVA